MYRPSAIAQRVCILASLCLLGGGAAQAASLTDAYARAEALFGKQGWEKVRNGYVQPRWVGSHDEFWYRRDVPGGWDFALVDAATGTKRPAFDHAALAKALAATLAKPVDPAMLPFTEFSFDPKDDRNYLTATIGAQQYRCDLKHRLCTAVPADRGDLSIAPDRQTAVFTREGNLWLRDLRAGTEHALTSDGGPDDGYGIYYDRYGVTKLVRERENMPVPPMAAYWSPDSSRVLVAHVDQRHVAEYPYIESAPTDGSFRPKVHLLRTDLIGEKPPIIEWYLFDVHSGNHDKLNLPVDQLFPAESDQLPLRKTWWSRDNLHLYVLAYGRDMRAAFFFDVDLSTRKVRTVIEERGSPRVDMNSSSYDAPNVQIIDDKQVVWFSQRDGWGHLYLYDLKTGALLNRITQGSWLVRDILAVDEKHRQIYFSAGGREAGNPYYRYLYRQNLDGSGLTLLSPESADHPVLSPEGSYLSADASSTYDILSPSGKYVVYTVSPIDQPPEIIVRSTQDIRRSRVIEKADISALLAAGYRAPKEVTVKAADGKTDLWCVIYRPANFDPAKKYPVIDAEYASPLMAVAPRNFLQAETENILGYATPASLAQLGFVVVVVDARGTPLRSREFSQAGFGQLNINGMDDHVAAIKAMAARFSYMDVSRVGVSGLSYGGYSAVRAMLEFPDFYKVGVAGVPMGNMMGMYSDYSWWAYQGRPVYSNGSEWRPSPTEEPQNWHALGVTPDVAGRLRGKLFIVMGELDEYILPGSILQLVHAFIDADRDFDFLYMPGTSHGFGGTMTPYVMHRTWNYFVRNLLHEEPPADHPPEQVP